MEKNKTYVGIFKKGNPWKSLDYWQGRQEEIAQIHQWLLTGNIKIIGIEGVGGIGKSTLATKIYHEEIPQNCFRKRFWGEVGIGKDFASLARQILEEFGYPVPQQEADLQDTLIRHLQAEQHLIIIDNAETLFSDDGTWDNIFYQQFFEAWMEYGDTSTILVTTRERLPLRGFNHWINLKGLKPPEGANLLKELQIRGDLEDFSRGVDGHPFLLRLIADLLLAEYPQDPSLDRLADLGLGNLQQYLTDERVRGIHRRETVGMVLVLDASFNRLSRRQQELFLYTSVYRGEFESVAAAALVNFSEENSSQGEGDKIVIVERELRELWRRSLLEENLRGKQRFFQFQPLVLEYAKYKTGDQTPLHQKAIAYYLTITKSQPWETLEDVKTYLEIFYHWTQLKVYDSAFEILRYIDDFLTLRGGYQVLADNYSELVTAYEKQEDQHNWKYTASLTSLGNAYNSLGQYQQAISYYQQSLAISLEIGDRNGEASSYMGLGNAYDSLGQYQQAISYHQQSLAISLEIGDRNGEATSYTGLGNAYYSLGQYQQAITYYQQSLAIKLEIGDRNGEAISYNNLGSAYNSLGQYQQAISYYQQSLAIFLEIGDRKGEANSYTGLGNAYYSLGQYQQAITYYQQSLAIKLEIGDRNGEANALFNLGLIFSKLNQPSEARDAYLQSRELYQAMGLDREVQDCNNQIEELKKRKYPLIVAFIIGVIKFPLVLIGGVAIGILRLLRKWLRLGGDN